MSNPVKNDFQYESGGKNEPAQEQDEQNKTNKFKKQVKRIES